jgi:hypothetical protein
MMTGSKYLEYTTTTIRNVYLHLCVLVSNTDMISAHIILIGKTVKHSHSQIYRYYNVTMSFSVFT